MLLDDGNVNPIVSLSYEPSVNLRVYKFSEKSVAWITNYRNCLATLQLLPL